MITTCSRFSLLLTLILTTLPGCAGGGGGGGGSGEGDLAARVYLSVAPGTLDTGDRTTVTIQIEEVNVDGAAIKIKFPAGLKYLPATSQLEIDGDIRDVAPTTNVSDGTDSYLVYYVSHSVIDDDSGILTLKLQGVAAVKEGEIEVEADLDDPAVDNQDEFNIETPNFVAEDSESIVVKG